MIIVNQEKNSIYNFDNAKSVDAIDSGIYITDDILSDKGTRIAEYRTEKRAKEVLQEIISKYRQWNTDANKAVTVIPKVYEMPKE